MKLLETITIPNFITEVKLSDKRRAQYFDTGSKIPKKYLNYIGKKYEFRNYKVGSHIVSLLTDKKTGEKVIKNPKVAGKPKFKEIKGNDFYTGFVHHSIRSNIIHQIKDFLEPYFRKLFPFKDDEYPLYIEFIYHDTRYQSQDLDNKRYAYEKCILDLLQIEGKLKNDNVDYVTKLSSEFISCEKDERKLVIKFWSLNKQYE